jgi:hypothetical protein
MPRSKERLWRQIRKMARSHCKSMAGKIEDFRNKKEVGYMSLYDLASRFHHAFGIIYKVGMEERLRLANSLGCAMPMSLGQFQSELSIPDIFQHSGVECSCQFIADSVLRAQSLGCYHCEMESRLMLDISQCQPCRHFILLILGALFYSIKRSLSFGLLLSQAMVNSFSLVQKCPLSQLSQSMVFGIQIHACHG